MLEIDNLTFNYPKRRENVLNDFRFSLLPEAYMDFWGETEPENPHCYILYADCSSHRKDVYFTKEPTHVGDFPTRCLTYS